MSVRILQGDALSMLKTIESESVQCVVTSPPYYALRSYGTSAQVWGGDPEHAHEWATSERGWNNRHEVARLAGLEGTEKGGAANHRAYRLIDNTCACGAWRGELGLEPTPSLFLEHLFLIFDEVWRVLRPDATCWVNLGDGYSGSGKGGPATKVQSIAGNLHSHGVAPTNVEGIPPKNLLLMPERFAIGMQERGWYVRSRIAWCKLSAMPESVRDRPTSAWEHIWLFSKSPKYFYDAEAVRQPNTPLTVSRHGNQPERRYASHKPLGTIPPGHPTADHPDQHNQGLTKNGGGVNGANLRNWWALGPEPLRESHYAAFPTEIPRRCILAGTSQMGGCGQCGAPWVRVVERGQSDYATSGKHGGRDFGRGDSVPGRFGQTRLENGTVPSLRAAPVMATGWQPSCSCDAGPPVPQVVLDPFLGSGTTALVADRLGRHAVGIELNPEYAEMARRRIESDEALFSPPVEVETDAGEQLDLFAGAAV